MNVVTYFCFLLLGDSSKRFLFLWLCIHSVDLALCFTAAQSVMLKAINLIGHRSPRDWWSALLVVFGWVMEDFWGCARFTPLLLQQFFLLFFPAFLRGVSTLAPADGGLSPLTPGPSKSFSPLNCRCKNLVLTARELTNTDSFIHGRLSTRKEISGNWTFRCFIHGKFVEWV